jgi:hypothetical protein
MYIQAYISLCKEDNVKLDFRTKNHLYKPISCLNIITRYSFKYKIYLKCLDKLQE